MLEPLCYFILEKSIQVFSVIFFSFLFFCIIFFIFPLCFLRPSLLLYQVQPGPLLSIVFLSLLLHFSFLFPFTVLCRTIFAAFSGKYYPLFNIVFVSVLSYFSYHWALKNPFCNSYMVNFNPEALFNIVLLSFLLYPFLMFPFTVL